MMYEQAISMAFRAAHKELGREPVKPDSYEAFLVTTGEHLDLAAQFFSKVVEHREEGSPETLTALEHAGFKEILQATVSALLALGHYPYLRRIEMQGEILQ